MRITLNTAKCSFIEDESPWGAKIGSVAKFAPPTFRRMAQAARAVWPSVKPDGAIDFLGVLLDNAKDEVLRQDDLRPTARYNKSEHEV